MNTDIAGYAGSRASFTYFFCHKSSPELTLQIKVKVIPLQAWTGPEISRRLRLPVFKTVGT
jgi:hypothetical protein